MKKQSVPKIDKDKIQTWFVTGASSGVGHELCSQLLKRGYNVVAVSRRVPDFQDERVLCLSCDVTDPESVKNAVAKGIAHFGRIDVLSNNAGISTSVVLEEETTEHIESFMQTNFYGTFNTIKALLPHFRENKNGTIINNSSMHGLSSRKGGAAYCSSKHAIEGLTSVCLLETEKFCRTIVFELGWFKGTTIGKGDMGSKRSEFPEYKNVTYFIPIQYLFINNLEKAINLIVNEVEKEKPRRRLILGKDAQIKAKLEYKWLQRDVRYSEKHLSSCIELPQAVDHYFSLYFKYLKYKLLKNIVWGKTRKRYKRKAKELHSKIRQARKYLKVV